MNKYLNFLSTQAGRALGNLPFFLSTLIPKRKNMLLFGSWFGNTYSDNPRYIYEHSLNKPELYVFWITKNKDTYNLMKQLGLPVATAMSLKGIWLQFRAGAIVFTHSPATEFYSCLVAKRTRRIQAWHGAPLKKIGHDDLFSTKNNSRALISSIIFPHRFDKYDLIFATGTPDKKIFERAFNVKQENVVITGYPRNDILHSDKRKISLAPPKSILYLPTFRGAPGSEFKLLDSPMFNHKKINKILNLHNCHLKIKLHPVQKLSQKAEEELSTCTNISLISDNLDTHTELKRYDALITDYSSIFFDYILTYKPTYMLPIDIEDYLTKDRAIYYNYPDVCPSEPQKNWESLLNYIFEVEYPVNQHLSTITKFHSYADANASERAIKEIVKIL